MCDEPQFYSYPDICKFTEKQFLAVDRNQCLELTVSSENGMLVDQYGKTHTWYSLTNFKILPIREKNDESTSGVL